jgi:hypothetical protein
MNDIDARKDANKVQVAKMKIKRKSNKERNKQEWKRDRKRRPGFPVCVTVLLVCRKLCHIYRIKNKKNKKPPVGHMICQQKQKHDRDSCLDTRTECVRGVRLATRLCLDARRALKSRLANAAHGLERILVDGCTTCVSIPPVRIFHLHFLPDISVDTTRNRR